MIWEWFKKRQTKKFPTSSLSGFNETMKYVSSSNQENARHIAPGERRSRFMAKPEDVSKLIEYVHLYGEGGIHLRELLMLASIKKFRTTESWDEAPDDMTFMQSFARNATRPDALVALRYDLVTQGQIIVRRQSPGQAQNHENWATDGQVWVARPRENKLSDTAQREFYEELIHIFNTEPDEGVPFINSRRIELFYNHARLVAIYLSQKALRTPTRSILGLGISQDSRQHFIHLVMNLLTYRYRDGDDKVLEDLLSLLVDSDTDPMLHPRSYIMREWAQMKRIFGSSIQTSSRAVEVIERLRISPQWSQGVVGFLLADSIKELKGKKDSEALDQVLRLSDEWCDAVYQSRDHEVMSALCIILPHLELWDKLARMPEAYLLECGFHLSRSGYPALAERYLVSGFSACESRLLGKYWRYQIELLAVIMRLGRWQEAEDKLQSSLQLLDREYNNATSGGGFDKWQLSGDFGEFKLSINCLLADCYFAKGDFLHAELLLRAPLDEIRGMRDHYIVSMRVAVQSRLLHAQLKLNHFPSAAATSLQQCDELLGYDGLLLDKRTISWVVDELLSCMNELVAAGELLEAKPIIDSLLVANDRITTLLTEEVRNYIQRRHQTVLRFVATKWPYLLPDVQSADTIQTTPGRPIVLAGPASTLSPPEKVSTAAIEFPGMSARTSTTWLQGHASDPPEIVQDTSAKPQQATAATKGSGKRSNKARNRLSATASRYPSPMRLSRLPSAPKSELGLSKSSSSLADLSSNHHASVIDLSDLSLTLRSTQRTLVAEDTCIAELPA